MSRLKLWQLAWHCPHCGAWENAYPKTATSRRRSIVARLRRCHPIRCSACRSSSNAQEVEIQWRETEPDYA